MKQQMREIAKLLSEEPNPKEEKARIRAEALIRDDGTIEAYEILQLSCELICERIKLIINVGEQILSRGFGNYRGDSHLGIGQGGHQGAGRRAETVQGQVRQEIRKGRAQ